MKKLGVILSVVAMLFLGVTLYAQEEKPQPSEEAPPVKVEKKAPAKYTSFGGGVQVISMTNFGEHVYTDFLNRVSVFMKGNIVPKKMGYFAHIMYLAKPDYQNKKVATYGFAPPVAFVWWNPVKFVNVRFGNLKKPSEWTYLPPWQTWVFELPPQIFGTMKSEKMTFVDLGVQAVASYKKLASLQLNVFRTDRSIKDKSFNLLYFVGAKVTPSFNNVKLGVGGFYGFEPHEGLMGYTKLVTSDAVNYKRNSLLAIFWVDYLGGKLFAEYISYGREGVVQGKTVEVKSTDLNVELSYKLKLAGVCLRPKIRYDKFDPNIDKDGDSKQAISLGVDFIMAQNPKAKMNYKFAVEYQINKEESDEMKNDQLRLVFQVGNF